VGFWSSCRYCRLPCKTSQLDENKLCPLCSGEMLQLEYIRANPIRTPKQHVKGGVNVNKSQSVNVDHIKKR